jgi:predicted RNA-binding Zn-ribbon protein involved in translation (DUF1610 family)
MKFEVKIFRDSFGRQITGTAQCEYCGDIKPVEVTMGLRPQILMRQFEYHGRTIWRCNECAMDIINQS